MRRAAVLLLAVLLAGCSSYTRICPRVAKDAGLPQTPGAKVAYVKFLGVGGFLVEYDGQAIMTAPLYSNPTVGELATQTLHSDHRLIDALLPDATGVQAILSGHSHYDHLMDVPYVALKHARQAVVYGNDDMERLLAPLPALQGRLESLETRAWRDVEPLRSAETCSDSVAFEPIGTRIRVWPIVSEHSPQFELPVLHGLPPVHLWRGTLLEPAAKLPQTAGDWVEGTTLSYLIDFMTPDGKQVALRVFYQDSGSRKPYGFPPPCLVKDRKVDLALLTVGGAELIAGHRHPGDIVEALEPSFVIGSHWEDFFNPRELPLPPSVGPEQDRCCETIRGVPLQDPKKFDERLRQSLRRDAQYALPCPDAWARLTPKETAAMGQNDAWRLEASSERWRPGARH